MGKGRGPLQYSSVYSTVLPEQRIKDGGLTGRGPPVPVPIPIPVPLVLVSLVPLRLRLVPDGVVGDLLTGALDPVAWRWQQVVGILGADLVCGRETQRSGHALNSNGTLYHHSADLSSEE